MGDRGGVGGGNKLLSVEIGREGDVEETKIYIRKPNLNLRYRCEATEPNTNKRSLP